MSKWRLLWCSVGCSLVSALSGFFGMKEGALGFGMLTFAFLGMSLSIKSFSDE